MPQPEEVDEINEFLKNRREKQRLGELPQEDYTPGFVKKVKLAIFGKPTQPKIMLTSSQPSYASSEAQAAVRKQLQEMVDTQNTAKPKAFATPTVVRANTPLVPTPRSSTPTPSLSSLPKPTASRTFGNVPYPPYIQRGLASLPKTMPAPVAVQRPQPISVENKTVSPLPNSLPTPRPTIPTPVRAAPTPALPVTPSPMVTRAPSPAPVRAFTTPTTNAPRPYYSAPASVTKTPIPVSTSPKKSFWKNIFGAKPPAAAAPTPVTSQTPLAVPKMPTQDYAYSPIAGVQNKTPVNEYNPNAAFKEITPVNKSTTAPAPSPVSPAQSFRPTPTLPSATKPTWPVAKTVSVPMITPQPKQNQTETSFTNEKSPKPRITESTLPSIAMGDGTAKPYLPPWVNKVGTPSPMPPSPSYSPSSLPWEGKQNSNSASVSKEIKVEEMSREARSRTFTPVPQNPTVSPHDAAVQEELSEEEVLERLPFEEVEGLSQNDLDYLDKKEKEHREAQKQQDLDQGIPSELKNTLRRQSSQLENVLQSTGTATPDEKQEILRRLKKMMEDEGHST